MPQYHKKSNLYIDCKVLTGQAIAEIINAILELLLYKRKQIPFTYKTYQHYVDKWTHDDQNCNNFQTQRQKASAKSTRESISAMKQFIRDVFDTDGIKTVRFLFGSTSSTPREAYTLHMPVKEVSSIIPCDSENHRLSTQKLNQILLNLVTDETLYDLFSSNLIATNIYLDFEIVKTESFHNSTMNAMFCKQIHKLPPSCKDIHFYFIPKFDEKTLNENVCFNPCKDMEIVQGIKQLNIIDIDNSESKQNLCTLENDSTWWEAEIFVRGFKEQHLNNINIWS